MPVQQGGMQMGGVLPLADPNSPALKALATLLCNPAALGITNPADFQKFFGSFLASADMAMSQANMQQGGVPSVPPNLLDMGSQPPPHPSEGVLQSEVQHQQMQDPNVVQGGHVQLQPQHPQHPMHQMQQEMHEHPDQNQPHHP